MVGTKRILVIDDDPDFLDYVRIVISANGYDVGTASSAPEGLEMMRHTPPDLVIVDVMMSYALDGWIVSQEMSSDPRLRHIPVIMVSAVVSEKDDALFPVGIAERVDAFMTKPVEPSALLKRIAELVQSS